MSFPLRPLGFLHGRVGLERVHGQGLTGSVSLGDFVSLVKLLCLGPSQAGEAVLVAEAGEAVLVLVAGKAVLVLVADETIAVPLAVHRVVAGEAVAALCPPTPL